MESYSVEAILSAVDKNFTGTMNGAMKSMDGMQSATKATTTSIAKVAAGIGVFKAISAAVNLLTNSLSGAVDRYDTLNKYPKVLEQLGFSTEQATSSTKKLSEGIDGLPTSLDDVVSTAQRLTVLTGNLEKSTDTTLALNNAFLASSASTADASRGMEQYIQMLSKGSVDLTSWRTLQETMGYALRETAVQLGVATGDTNELYDALKEGTITFDQFNDALIECSTRTGGFAEVALTAAGGIKTSMTNIQTAVTKGMANVIGAIDQVLEKNGLPKIEQALNSVKGAINNVFGSAELLDDGTYRYSGGIIGWIASLEDLKGTFAGVGAVITSAFVLAGASGFDVLIKKGSETGGVFDLLRSKVGNIGSSLKNLPSQALGGLDGIKTKLAGLVPDSLTNQIHNLGVKAKGSFGMLGDYIGQASFKFGAMTGRFSTDAPKAWKVFDTLKEKAGVLPSVLGKAGTGLQQVASIGAKTLSGMASALTSVMGFAISAVGPVAIIGLAIAGLGVLDGVLGEQINGFIQKATTEGPKIIQGFVDGIVSRLPELMTAGSLMLANILNAITANLPTIIQGGMQIITALVQGVISNLPVLIPAAVNLITTFATSIIQLLPQILILGLEILVALVQGVISNMDLIMNSIMLINSTITNAITQNLPTIIALGIQILLMLVQGIVQMLPQLIVIGLQSINTLIQAISANLPAIIQAGVLIIMMLIQGIVTNLPAILQSAIQVIQSLIQGIADNLPQIITAGFQIILMLIVGIIQMLPEILSAGWEIIKSLATGIIEAIPQVLESVIEGIKGIFTGLWDFITGKNEEGSATTKEQMESLADSMQTSTSTMSENAQIDFSNMNVGLTTDAASINSGVSSSFDAMSTNASSATGDMLNNVTGDMAGINSSGSTNIDNLASNISSSSSSANSSASSNFDSMANNVNSSMNSIQTSSTSSLKSIQNSYNTTFSAIAKKVTSAMASINSAMSSAMRTFVSTVNSGMNSAKSATTSGINGIISSFQTLQSKLYSIGIYAMQGFTNGIRSGAGAAIAAANAVANQIATTMRSALDVNSPSKVTTEIGEFAGIGPAIGLTNMIPKVKKAGTKMAKVLVNAMEPVSVADFSGTAKKYSYASYGEIAVNYNNGNSENSVVSAINDLKKVITEENREYVLNSTLEISGRTAAQATASYTQEQLKKIETLNNRRNGIRTS